MEKRNFYINIGTGEISQIEAGNNHDFIISATEEEVGKLREVLTEMYNSDIRAFFRMHLPKPYHEDQPNDEYDAAIKDAFRMIYELGDTSTKQHIESMQII